MFRFRKRQLTFLAPDIVEQNGGEYLLVWRDIPHWMVCDEELYSLLKMFDGSLSIEQVCALNPGWLETINEIIPVLKKFYLLRILRTGNGRLNKVRDRIRIENITINITSICNLKCTYCYNESISNKPIASELPVRDIISFLKVVRAYCSKEPLLSILGGEPLTEPQKTIEVARYAAGHGFRTLISTNGTQVTEEFTRAISEIGVEVQVSLDGACEKSHDLVRGEGSFSRSLSGIKTLVEGKVHTILSMVCHKGNVHELEEYFKLGEQLKVNEVRFIPLKRVGSASECSEEPVELSVLMNQAKKIFLKHPEYQKLSGRDAFNILGRTCEMSALKKSCGIGNQTLLLDSDGSLYPCLNLKHSDYSLGNVKDCTFSFKRLWRESSPLNEVRRCTSIVNEDHECFPCAVKHWCLGGCCGENYALERSFGGKAWNCDELRRAHLDMFWTLSQNELF